MSPRGIKEREISECSGGGVGAIRRVWLGMTEGKGNTMIIGAKEI